MTFYKIEAKTEPPKNDDKSASKYDMAYELAEMSDTFCRQYRCLCYLFVSSLSKTRAVFGAVVRDDRDINLVFNHFAGGLPFPIRHYTVTEITLKNWFYLFRIGSRGGFLTEGNNICEQFNLPDLHTPYFTYNEYLLENDWDDEQLRCAAQTMLFSGTLIPELDRIKEGAKQKSAKGHPVHYLLRSENPKTFEDVCQTLLGALYLHKRIRNKRYCIVDFANNSSCPDENFDALYTSCEGGTMVIRYNGVYEETDEFENNNLAILNAIEEAAYAHRHTVLTVVCLSPKSTQAAASLAEAMHPIPLVEINEEIVFGKPAEQYLKAKAKAVGVRTDKTLFAPLSDTDKGFSAAELDRHFEEWHNQKVLTRIYPQYKTLTSACEAIRKQAPKGSAFEELQKMIGLETAKNTLHKALQFYKAQKLFSHRGFAARTPSMHMVFTGNPGTAKTTVARLFAQILKENRILPCGHLVEVGRADLVGKFVGHTAPLVKKAFQAAKGGVLFIDEAYSLVDGREGLFGDEAINTIVQEMENHRKDTIVILAGYPDKMETFINRNPGLRSRIAFHIPFEDYAPHDLCRIAALLADKQDMTLSEEANQKLEVLFDDLRRSPDFGNGRCARNLIEKAILTHAERLVAMDYETITDRDITTLTAEDFDDTVLPGRNRKTTIGFAV